MKYGIRKFYEAKPAEGGSAAPVTKDLVLKEFTTIKDALEKSLTEKADAQAKNVDEKIKAVNIAIEELKAVKPEVTADELKEIQEDLKLTIKSFDILQTRIKEQQMKGYGGRSEEDTFMGKLNTAISSLKENIHGDQIKGGAYKTPIVLKAVQDMTVAASVSTGVVPNTYRTGIVPLPFEMVHMRDIVAVTPSETDSYHFYRHTLGEGSIEFQTNENAQKNQIDEDLLEQTVNLNYLAGWLKISKKMLRNFKGLQGYLSRWLPERYYQREDTKAYQVLISGATGVSSTVTGKGMIGQIIQTIGLQKKAKYNVNGVVVDGAVWANILTYTTTAGEFSQPGGVITIGGQGQLMIMGIPVYTASWVGSDEAIVGDWRYFEIIQSEALSLQFFDQDGDNVKENKITARIEASVGFALLDPAAFAVVSLESVS